MDHYSTLGVNKNASPEDIKKAYRRLANQHHPDKGGDAAQFQKLQEAYSTLSDPQKKAAYDNPQPQFDGFGGFPEDIFSHFFGGGGFHHHRNRKQVAQISVDISLHDAYTGGEKSIQLNTPQGLKTINVKIPRGVDTGNQVQYDNLIDSVILIIRFNVMADSRFERNGQNLYSKQNISVLDLIVGTTITVKTISGKELKVSVKPNTQPNSQIRISGHGMPIVNSNHYQYGDYFLIVNAVIPENINQEIIDAIVRNKN